MAWDLNLCLDSQDKVFVPFHHFVKPWQQQHQNSSSQPFNFLGLPTDIQLMVYEYCDKPALFQLMRTCSHTRAFPVKLFWADTPELPWYHHSEDHSKLFSYGTEHHPILHHCPEFARRITKLEVSSIHFDLYFERESGSSSQEPVSTAEKAKSFWQKLVKGFPAVQRVVLAGHHRSLKRFNIIETVVEYAPPQVLVRISLEYNPETKPRRCMLYQLINKRSSTWRVVNEDWKPTRVLLPSRRFPDSPFGNFLEMIQRNHALLLEVRGLHTIRTETYVRYAVDGIIHCPQLDCNATFATRRRWEIHMRKSRHHHTKFFYANHDNGMPKLSCWKHTPDSEQADLDARQRRIDLGYQKTRKLARRVACGWGKEGSEQRRLFEEEFLTQLRDENFAAPRELLKDSVDNWIGRLRLFFEPPRYYHEDADLAEWVALQVEQEYC